MVRYLKQYFVKDKEDSASRYTKYVEEVKKILPSYPLLVDHTQKDYSESCRKARELFDQIMFDL